MKKRRYIVSHLFFFSVALDFGKNDLTGSIDVIDNYSRLVSISVNDNRFAGDVPQSLWNNTNLLSKSKRL